MATGPGETKCAGVQGGHDVSRDSFYAQCVLYVLFHLLLISFIALFFVLCCLALVTYLFVTY